MILNFFTVFLDIPSIISFFTASNSCLNSASNSCKRKTVCKEENLKLKQSTELLASQKVDQFYTHAVIPPLK